MALIRSGAHIHADNDTNGNHSRRLTNFLSLPEELRFRIYHYYADMAPNTPCVLQEKDGVPLFSTLKQYLIMSRCWKGTATYLRYDLDESSKRALAPFKNIRLVNRTVNADVPRYLCANHRIVLLGPDLSTAALSILSGPPWNLLDRCKSLDIVLNISRTPGTTPDCACCGDIRRYFRSTGRPYLFWVENIQPQLPAWNHIIDYLRTSPSSSNLDLRIICDMDEPKTAEPIVQSLEQLQVSSCAVRLRSRYDEEFEAIARKAVLGATSYQNTAYDCFRFLDLPPELRQRILSFTDLVTPSHEVQWGEPSSGRGTTVAFHLQERTHRLSIWCCSSGNLCSRVNSAYPPCGCFRSPLPLFLTCKTMLQDAHQVFLSSNRFILLSKSRPYSQMIMDRKDKFEAAIFLTKIIPEQSLRHLRDLELHFPSRAYSHLGMRPYIRKGWEEAVQYAAQHLKKLKLTLYMGGERHPQPDAILTDDVEQALRSLFGVHRQIVLPFRQLRPILDECFVFASSPFDCSEADLRRFQPAVKEHEKRMERLVMGEGYDSNANGKAQRVESRWRRHMYDEGP